MHNWIWVLTAVSARTTALGVPVTDFFLFEATSLIGSVALVSNL